MYKSSVITTPLIFLALLALLAPNNLVSAGNKPGDKYAHGNLNDLTPQKAITPREALLKSYALPAGRPCTNCAV